VFERIESPAGLAYYRSSLLAQAGVPHGFSTRIANQGQECDLAAVAADASSPSLGMTGAYQQFLQAAGCGDFPLVYLKQVHGKAVQVADASDAGQPREADGLVTASPGVALSIRVADCVPILLAAVRHSQVIAVSAVHAGWRGVVAGIVHEAIRTLHQQPGVGDARLLAAIGPCISCQHFEVGPEVATAFTDCGLDAAIVPQPGGAKPHIDLQLACRLQLLASGLTDQDIDSSHLCTYSDRRDFYSHRRDHGQTGRLAAVIPLPAGSPESVRQADSTTR